MVVVKVLDGKEMYIDENLKNNLDKTKESVDKKGWDYFAVVAGIPRVGKSTLAQQIACYLDPTFNLDRFCFTADEYIKKSTLLTKGQAIILDESFADLNTNLSRSPEFTRLVNHMQTIGQNNLFHIFVLPDFFSLSKTVANFRTSHLFVVYAEDYERGRFAAFGRLKKAKLYEDGKRYSNYQACEPNFRGRYLGKWFLDEEKYKLLKKKHQEEQAKVVVKTDRFTLQRNKLIKWLVEKKDFTETEIAEALGLTHQAVSWIVTGNSGDVPLESPNPSANIT
jgi:hypothetical protein